MGLFYLESLSTALTLCRNTNIQFTRYVCIFPDCSYTNRGSINMEDHIQVSHMVGMDYKCHAGMEKETEVRARISVSFCESFKNYKGEISNIIQQRHFHRIFEICLTQTCSNHLQLPKDDCFRIKLCFVSATSALLRIVLRALLKGSYKSSNATFQFM